MKHLALGLLLGGFLMPSLAFAQVQPNDPLSSLQWYLQQIDAKNAWETSTGSGEVLVAVLDSGVDIDHEDLADNIFTNVREIPGDRIDNDGNGYIDDVTGWDFYSADNDPRPEEDRTASAGVHHGTAVAGIIGAVGNNQTGVTGINWDVSILPVRVLNTYGDGTMQDIVDAINYSVDMGADVINLSFVGEFSSRQLDDAIQRAYDNNVIVVAAAGNQDGGLNLDTNPRYPVCNDGNGTDNVVIGVAATTQSDERASFSNYGSNCIDISAPGVLMMTTQVETRLTEAYEEDWSGTSFAAPVISGSAALVRSVFPEATPAQVLTVLQLSVDPVRGRAPNGRVSALGAGRVNLSRAFEVVETILGEVPVRSPDTDQAPVNEPVPVTQVSSGLVIAASAGDEPRVGVLVGDSVASWLAYAPGFTGGVHARIGDVHARTGQEVVTAPLAGGGPHIRVFTTEGELLSEFFAYGATFTRGVTLDLADVDADGLDEIIIVSADARLPVRVFEVDGTLLEEIPLPHTLTAPNLQVEDLNGDTYPELILTDGEGDPTVRIYSFDGSPWNAFRVYAEGMNKGVVASTYGGFRPRVVVGTGPGAGPHVRIFNRAGAFVTQFFAYAETDRNGVSVAYQNVDGVMRIAAASKVNGQMVLRYFDEAGVRIGAQVPLSGFKNYVTISGE